MAFKGAEEVSQGGKACPFRNFRWSEIGIQEQFGGMLQSQIPEIFDGCRSEGCPEVSEQGAAGHGREGGHFVQINFALEVLLEETDQFGNIQGDSQHFLWLELPGIAQQAEQSHKEPKFIAMIAGFISILRDPEGKGLEFGEIGFWRCKAGEIPVAVTGDILHKEFLICRMGIEFHQDGRQSAGIEQQIDQGETFALDISMHAIWRNDQDVTPFNRHRLFFVALVQAFTTGDEDALGEFMAVEHSSRLGIHDRHPQRKSGIGTECIFIGLIIVIIHHGLNILALAQSCQHQKTENFRATPQLLLFWERFFMDDGQGQEWTRWTEWTRMDY